MARLLQLSKVKAQREPGKNKIKRIQFEGFPEPARMGVHGGIAGFFNLAPDEPLPSTLDYVVGAVAGCLTGTVAGALEARGIPSDTAHLQADAEGTIEEIDGKMLLTNISVRYRLKVPKDKRESIEKVLEKHDSVCPVSASIKRGITIQWKSEIEAEEV